MQVILHIQTVGVMLKLKALETGKPQIEDVVIQLANKEHMFLQVNVSPHFNEHGVAIGVSMVYVNITEHVMFIIVVSIDKLPKTTKHFCKCFWFKI